MPKKLLKSLEDKIKKEEDSLLRKLDIYVKYGKHNKKYGRKPTFKY